MGLPLLPMALMAGGGLLNNVAGKYFGGRTPFNMTNPADFKNQIVMGEGEASGIRNNLLGNLMSSQAKSTADIKQSAAANRLPEGAALSAMAGTNQSIAKGMSNLEPQLKQQQRSSLLDYWRLQQGYDAAKLQHESGNVQSQAAFNQGALGNLSNMAILWKAGIINGGGG
jgi:hypothetical protein